LYYPEIDFWQDLSVLPRCRAKLRDKLRMAATVRADGWFFETEDIRQRASVLLQIPQARSTVILPVAPPAAKPRTSSHGSTTGRSVLVASSWNPNKNLTILPSVAHVLQRLWPGTEVRFVLTVSADDPRSVALLRSAEEIGVENALEFIGHQDHNALMVKYQQCDAVLLMSRLESFSNNIVEAWATYTPLVVTKAPWATVICQSGAVYINRDDPENIARTLLEVMCDPDLRDRVISSGRELLKRYPDTTERARQIIDFSCSIVSAGRRVRA
jgi:glycosyltransferase involved in cell wall biosynthesis